MRSRGERASSASGRVLARAALAALCSLCVALAFAATASAAVPVYDSTFDCSTTPDLACSNAKAAVDQATGDVYLIDQAHDAVDRFDARGNYISQIRGSDTTAGGFGFGGEDGIAVDNSGGATQGNVYVTAENSSFGSGDAIFAFDPYGRELWERAGISGDTCGVAVDMSGNPWVADYTGQSVTELRVADGTATGTVVSTAGAGDFPCEIAFDSNDNLYVNSWHNKLDKFDSSGNFVSNIEPNPTFDVDVDLKTNEVYAVVGNTDVHVWDSTGTEETGSPFSSRTNITGVTVDGAHGRVYVIEYATSNVVDIYLRQSGSPEPYVRTTQDASGVAGGSATLNGTVNPAGDSTTCEFQYVDDAQFQSNGFASAQSQACDTQPGSGTSDVPVSTTLTGLSGGTYHFRLVATNSAGTNNGSASTFGAIVQHTLTVVVNGSGRVDDDQGRIVNCTSSGGSNCVGTYTDGTVVTLTPTPGTHMRLSGWSGDCSGTGACQVTMTSDRNVTATFVQIQHNVTVNCTGSGSVSPIGCGQTQAKDEGSSVALTATPASGSSFDGWTGCDSVTNTTTCNVTVTGNRTVTAAFRQNPPITHNLTVSTSGSGSVTSSAGGINCGSACSATLNDGTSVTLTAAPAAGWQFDHWSGCDSVAGTTCNVTMGSDKTVTATFRQNPPPVAHLVIKSGSATVSKGKAPLKVSCVGDAGATCTGKLTLKATVKKGKKKKTITVGTVSVNLAAGKSATLSVKLSGAAKSALAKKPHKLSAKVSGTVSGKSVSKTVTLKQAVKKKKKH